MTYEPVTWEALDAGLRTVLRELTAGTVLQLFEVARIDVCLAQFWQTEDRLTAELPAPELVRDVAHAGARFSEFGWAPDPSGTWRLVLDWPALPEEYRRLAVSVLGVLRDVLGVDDPEGMAYSAWAAQDGTRVTLPRLGLDAVQVTYYARLGPGDIPQQPKGLSRRIRAGYRTRDEALDRTGEWRVTETVHRAELRELGEDRLVPLEEALAAQVAVDWRRHVPTQAADPSPAVELRWASAPELRRDELAEVALRERPRLHGFDRAAVAGYLRGAPVALSAMGLGADVLDPSAAEVVPMNIRTDGTWVWSEALAYFAERYGIAPEPAFLAHLKRNEYRCPAVDEQTLMRAARLR